MSIVCSLVSWQCNFFTDQQLTKLQTQAFVTASLYRVPSTHVGMKFCRKFIAHHWNSRLVELTYLFTAYVVLSPQPVLWKQSGLLGSTWALCSQEKVHCQGQRKRRRKCWLSGVILSIYVEFKEVLHIFCVMLHFSRPSQDGSLSGPRKPILFCFQTTISCSWKAPVARDVHRWPSMPWK